MLPINEKSALVMDHLVEGLDRENRSKKIKNCTAFMPVTIEYLQEIPEGVLFSVCHYYEQNGDLMRDPEVVFIRREKNLTVETKGSFYFPVSFQQDNPVIYQELISFDENGNFLSLAIQQQRSCAEFGDTWMQNINYQQQLNLF